jgi:hypothetical protein
MKTIPAAALQALGNGSGALSIGRASRTTVQAGAYEVSFLVRDAIFGIVTITP